MDFTFYILTIQSIAVELHICVTMFLSLQEICSESGRPGDRQVYYDLFLGALTSLHLEHGQMKSCKKEFN